jgi:hypothetical protein
VTAQDAAILVLLQLAVLVAGALAVWTAYVAGHDRGWVARRELDPFYQIGVTARRVGEALRNMARRLQEVDP